MLLFNRRVSHATPLGYTDLARGRPPTCSAEPADFLLVTLEMI